MSDTYAYGKPGSKSGGGKRRETKQQAAGKRSDESFAKDLAKKGLAASYAVKVGDKEVSCLSCTGIGMETVYTEVEVGGQSYPEKVIETTRFTEVTLKRVVDQDGVFSEWYRLAQQLKPKDKDKVRREVYIGVENRAGKEIKRWTLVDAVPCRYSGPDLEVGEGGESFATETIVLSYKGILEEIWRNT